MIYLTRFTFYTLSELETSLLEKAKLQEETIDSELQRLGTKTHSA